MYIIYSVDQRDYTEQAVGLFPRYCDMVDAYERLQDALDDFHTLEVRTRDGRFFC